VIAANAPRRRTAFFLGTAAAALVMLAAGTAWAALSASGGFTLIRKIPPGETIEGAVAFLGEHARERTVDEGAGIKVRRWGTPGDTWFFDVLHDGEYVRAARVTWATSSKRDQQTIFSQLTTSGKKFFGRTGTFKGMSEAEWRDFDGSWIVRARIGNEIADGVTLLSGIRDEEMDSGRFGF
jgi:hypothetical protein